MADGMLNLLRQTCATNRMDEVCFVYVLKNNINLPIFHSRFGDASVAGDGVTYSLSSRQLE